MTGAEPCTTNYGFFPDTYAPHNPEVAAAEAMCRSCPLVRACFIWALANFIWALANPSLTADGIWGATTPWQRRELRRRLLHRLGAKAMVRTLRAEYARAVASAPDPPGIRR
jgi:WhiB family redox-sensing transcriptional regulator